MQTLHTKRLLLRPPADEDYFDLFTIRSNQSVNKYLDRDPAKDPTDAKIFIEKVNSGLSKNESYYWVILQRDQPTVIGTICLWNFSADRKTGELGYELLPGFQGMGFMDEALTEVIRFSATQGFEFLEAFTHKENHASEKLLIKHGFLRDEKRKDPDNADLIMFFLEINKHRGISH